VARDNACLLIGSGELGTARLWGHPLKGTLSEKKYSLNKKEVNFLLKADGIC